MLAYGTNVVGGVTPRAKPTNNTISTLQSFLIGIAHEGEYFKMWGYFQFPLVFTSVKEPVVKVSLSLSGSYGDGSNAVNTGVPTLDSK